MGAGTIILILVLLLIRGIATTSQAGLGSSFWSTRIGFATVSRLLLFVAWFGFATHALSEALRLLEVDAVISVAALLEVALMAVVIGAGACMLFFAWPTLRALARRGRPRLVYYLARVALVSSSTGETRSGACLLALLALAHRGAATKAERSWIERRLRKEKCHHGTYATARALHLLLEARAARDDGRGDDAHELLHRARALLGTVTYMSNRGAPRPVRRIVWEVLGLDDARRGNWGSLEIAPEKDLTPLARVLRGWAREHLMTMPAEKRTERARRRLASPVLDGLLLRSPEPFEPEDARALRGRAQRDLLSLVRGDAIGSRHVLNVLVVLDVLLHPEFEETLLPAAIRADEELVTSLHEQIAEVLTGPILRHGAPLFAMTGYGPISARVYQRVEAALLAEMERELRLVDDRTSAYERLEPFDEWLQVSRVRSAYRRLEHALGPDAAAHVWPSFAASYGGLGVQLSETHPRRRPLAHAVFKCLANEAARFEDQENIRQQAHNMAVTAGLD